MIGCVLKHFFFSEISYFQLCVAPMYVKMQCILHTHKIVAFTETFLVILAKKKKKKY